MFLFLKLFSFFLILNPAADASVGLGKAPLEVKRVPSVLGRAHLNFEKELASVQALIEEARINPASRFSEFKVYLSDRQRVLLDRKKNLQVLKNWIRSSKDQKVLAVEQSSVELAARSQKLKDLLSSLREVAANYRNIPGAEKTLADVFLVVAGEEFYLAWLNQGNFSVKIFPSEGNIKNIKISSDPQRDYNRVAREFKSEIQTYSKNSKKAEKIFKNFIQNYHLYIGQWESSISKEGKSLPQVEQEILKKHLLNLKRFFRWNELRDIAMVRRVSRLKGEKVLLAGSGHRASLKNKIENAIK